MAASDLSVGHTKKKRIMGPANEFIDFHCALWRKVGSQFVRLIGRLAREHRKY